MERIAALEGARVLAVSSLYETAPVGGPPGQRPYANAVVMVETDLGPEPLLAELLSIERDLGRLRGPERNEPRSIDIDLLLLGDAIVSRGAACVVPHPRLAERAFVLAPLAEIAPHVRVPGIPGETAASLLSRADRSGLLRRSPFLEALPRKPR